MSLMIPRAAVHFYQPAIVGLKLVALPYCMARNVRTERPALDRPLYRLVEAFGLKRYCPHLIATSGIQHNKKTYDLGFFLPFWIISLLRFTLSALIAAQKSFNLFERATDTVVF